MVDVKDKDVKDRLKTLIAEENFYYWGIGSSLILLMGLIIPQFGFIGLKDQRYSMLNHFVSELGDIVVSEWHMIFNVFLFIGGIFMIPFVIGLGLYVDGKLRKSSVIIGVICAVGCAFVGVFPMNNLLPHAIAAMTFFIGSIILTVFMNISILTQKEIKIPKWTTIIGFGALAFLGLFFSVDIGAIEGEFTGDLTEALLNFDRPLFWDIAFYEWGVVLGVLLFIMVIAIIAAIRNSRKYIPESA